MSRPRRIPGPVHAPRCVAPVGDGEELCSEPATTTRTSDGLECPLCARHATEIDNDREEEQSR